MEDDDEFGDLYTDVLRPLMTTSFQPPQAQLQLPPKEAPEASTSAALTPSGFDSPIDLNAAKDDEDGGGGDELAGAPNSRPPPHDQTLASSSPAMPDGRDFDLNEEFGREVGASEGIVAGESDSKARVLCAAEEDVNLTGNGGGRSSGDVKAVPEVVTEVKKESEGKDGDFLVKDEKKGVDDLALDSGIPGISIPGVSAGASNPNLDDDWDSDSEDDLQIVLNENNHGQLGMGGGGGVGPMEGEEEDEDDEDGEPLVIVADNGEPGCHQPMMMMMDEQEWGVEDSGPGADGEKKDPVEAGKGNGVGANAAAAKTGYGGIHGYQHPFHSQFKYVRPGASPIPGPAPGGPGVPGQVRPPVGMVPSAGRGRGDWRPPGIKGSGAMQKGFYQGFGMPAWGAGGSGRGLEFTLPSHKTIFEVDIDGFEEKPWRLNGVDVSDFFNFGLTEESWKDYCKQLEQLRAETTMQGRIRVYESGRAEQEYDPDLPPELAAVAGVQDIQSESLKLGKTDPSQDDMARAAARARPPLPTGRAIQVETGYGERLPSIDTRKPRISDLDVIIEIVCQDSVDDDTKRSDEMADQAETDSVRDGIKDDDELEEPQEDTDHLSRSPRAYNNNSHKREVEGRRMLSAHNNETGREDNSEAPPEYNTESREETPVYLERSSAGSHEDRRSMGRVYSRSPAAANKENMVEKRTRNNKESSVESIDGKSSPHASSPVSVEISAEPKDSLHGEIVRLDTVSDVYKEESSLNAEMENDTLTDGTRSHSSKKQKLSSQSEPSVPQEDDDQEDSKAARSSGNSKARSGSSNYQKPHDVGDEDEVQGGHVKSRGNVKRASAGDEDSVRRKIRDDRQDNERHRGPVKGREDLYQQKGRDSYRAHGSREKSEAADPRWDIDSAEGTYQQRDEDIHGRRTRAEDLRKREHRDDTSSRQRSKAREVERNEKDENPRLRKQLDNGNWRGSYDKALGIRHRDRDDGLKAGNENLDDIYSKRRKEEAQLAREMVDKEESLPAHRENNTHRKRQRADVPDQRRRDDQVKARDIDQHSARHKEDGSFPRERGDRHREREEWHRLKQMNQEGLSKKDKEVARGGMRSGRAAEEKLRGSQSRGKDEHRGSDKDFHPKDAGRQHDSLSKRDRVENVNLPQQRGREDFYAHGNQVNGEERRPRHERSVTREDHAASASDNRKVQESRYREIPRKGKEFEVLDRNSLAHSKKHHNETGGHTGDMMRPRGRVEHSSRENETHANNPSSKKPGDEASSDDELSESRRGRSKLERWNSHKEKDFGTSGKSSSSSKLRQIESHNSSGGAPVASKHNDEASKITEDKQQYFGNEKDVGGLETNNSDKKPVEERHLDTVEKLKKRSERFKLPMPSEKEATTIKKVESEPLPSTQSETRADAEVKAERPARKRRWTGS